MPYKIMKLIAVILLLVCCVGEAFALIDTSTDITPESTDNAPKNIKKEAYSAIAVFSIVISLMITLMGLVKYIFARTLS